VSATKRTRSTQLIDGQMDGLFANLERTSEQEGRVASAPVVVSCTPLIG
jgi:hypothetical protein